MPTIKLFDREKSEPEKRDPTNRREKIYNVVYQRTYTSGFVIVVALLSFFFGIIPLPFVGLMPTWAAEGFLIFIIASIAAFIPARIVHNYFKDFPVDYIFEINASTNEEPAKAWQYYEGKFIEDFDVVEGSIESWQNVLGKRAYLVNDIDRESQEVEASYRGELNDIELMETKEKIEAQRLKNRKWSRVGMKLFARFESIEDKAKTEYFQNLVRKGIELKSYDPEKLLDTVEDEIPEMTDDREEESELEKMMDMINSDSTNTELNINTGIGGENDE